MSKSKQPTDSTSKDRIIEFRFNCPYKLREKMIERLKVLEFDRSDLMCTFLEEWLEETKDLGAVGARNGA